MKILNLDDFASTNRQVKLKGITHEVLPLTVQQFIDSLVATEKAEAERAAKGTPEDVRLSKQVELMIPAIHQGIPTLDEATIRQMPIDAMYRLVEFVRGDLDDDTAAPAAEGEGSDAKKPT